MGMGWHIYRRTAVNAYLILILVGQLITPMGMLATGNSEQEAVPAHGPLKPLMLVQPSLNPPYYPEYILSMQGHASSKSWTDGMSDAMVERHEINHWISQWLSDGKLKRLVNAINRAYEFRSEVDSILRNAGMPWEIIAIPVVESSWRVNAVSSSNAVGPWQFMEASGRGRDLIIDTWRDERRGIWLSTEAAAKELGFSYKLFDDWFLAMASYNAGPTRMRILKTEGNFQDFWAMMDAGVIPEETQDYVPQIIAVSYVQSHAGRLGLPIRWDTPTQWMRVPLAQPVHLGKLAENFGLDRELFLLANTELNQMLTPPGSYTLKVPIGNRTPEEINELIQQAGLGKDHFLKYIVRSGDTLSEIAKNFGISTREILDFNLKPSSYLRAGERLYIPVSADYSETAYSDVPQWHGRYKVQPGDSLWSISRRFGVTPELLAEVNYRSITSVLAVGSILRVPGDNS